MNLTLVLPVGEFIYTGRQVTFEAPCESEGLTGLIVGGVLYDLVDAFGDTPVANSFDKGALVSVIFHVEKQKAFIQNANTNAYIESRLSEIANGKSSDHQMFFGENEPVDSGPWIWLQTIGSRALDSDDAVLELSMDEPEDGDVVAEIDGTEYTVENASTNPDDVGEGEYLFSIEH